MKKLFLFLLMGFSLVACKKDNAPYEDEFNQSYRAWQRFKDSTNNSYQYTVYSGSWTGSSTETVIIVKEDMVIERSYVLKVREINTNVTTVRDSWTERGATVNTHADGAIGRTLDDVYEKAKKDWLIKRDKADVYFEAKNNGMISSAGFVPHGCQDDCFMGIHITSITGR